MMFLLLHSKNLLAAGRHKRAAAIPIRAVAGALFFLVLCNKNDFNGRAPF